MRFKYLKGGNILDTSCQVKRKSSTWRDIKNHMETVIAGLNCLPVNGKKVQFWTDKYKYKYKWVGEMEKSIKSLPLDARQTTVAEMLGTLEIIPAFLTYLLLLSADCGYHCESSKIWEG